jgi:hypothetical protein
VEGHQARTLDRGEEAPEAGQLDLLPAEPEPEMERVDAVEAPERIDAEDRAVDPSADQDRDIIPW